LARHAQKWASGKPLDEDLNAAKTLTSEDASRFLFAASLRLHRTKMAPLMNVHGGSRQILIHGAILVLVGLVWGLVVPGRRTQDWRLELTSSS
jgi:hypothetical protein